MPEDDLTATPQAFLKEISSDGNVNTVDVIFQSWPIFVSLNPEYIKYLLQPIMSYMAAGRWPEQYVIVSDSADRKTDMYGPFADQST